MIKFSAIFLLITNLCAFYSCKNSELKNSDTNYTIINARIGNGILKFKVQNLINQSSDYELPDYTGGRTTGYQEYKFLYKNDTGTIKIRISIAGKDSCIDSSSLIFGYLKNEIQELYRFSKSFSSEKITVSDINLYSVYYNSGSCTYGCFNEKAFRIYIEDIKDSIFVHSFINSLQIEK